MDKNIVAALELTLWGLLVVFGALTLFYLTIVLLGKLPDRKPKNADDHQPAAPAPVAAPATVELIGLDEPTAAMVIAIVAEKTGVSPDQLPLLSIKKV